MAKPTDDHATHLNMGAQQMADLGPIIAAVVSAADAMRAAARGERYDSEQNGVRIRYEPGGGTDNSIVLEFAAGTWDKRIVGDGCDWLEEQRLTGITGVGMDYQDDKTIILVDLDLPELPASSETSLPS